MKFLAVSGALDIGVILFSEWCSQLFSSPFILVFLQRVGDSSAVGAKEGLRVSVENNNMLGMVTTL